MDLSNSGLDLSQLVFNVILLIPFTDWAHNARSAPFKQSKNAHSVPSLSEGYEIIAPPLKKKWKVIFHVQCLMEEASLHQGLHRGNTDSQQGIKTKRTALAGFQPLVKAPIAGAIYIQKFV